MSPRKKRRKKPEGIRAQSKYIPVSHLVCWFLTQNRSHFSSCLEFCFQGLLKTAAWIRPTEWTHRRSPCILMTVNGGALLSKMHVASVQDQPCFSSSLTVTEFPRTKVCSGCQVLALALLRVTWPQAPCFVIGSLWISVLIPEQILTNAAICLNVHSVREGRSEISL